MFYYDQSPKKMMVDLINEGNPQLPFPINMTDYDFMEPVGIDLTEEGHNTEIRVIARPSAPYIGNVVLTYRRLNLANLFQGLVPFVRKWVANSGSTTSNTWRIYLYDLLPLFSKKYGLKLDETQIEDVHLRERDGNDPNRKFYLTAKDDSLIYTGRTYAQWKIGRRELESLLGEDDIEGVKFPGGNDFTVPDDRLMYLTPTVFERDFTVASMENASDWEYTNTRYLGDTTSSRYVDWFDAMFEPFADAFEEATGIRPTYSNKTGYKRTDYDFGGFYIRRTSLPTSRYPEANHHYYNMCVVLETPDDCTWGQGFIYMHYNV